MRRALLALPTLALSFTLACDSGEETTDSDFRAIPGMDQQALEIGIELFNESGDGDGTVIWDIKEVGIFEGSAADGQLLLTTDLAGNVYDSQGVKTCSLVSPYLQKNIIQVTGLNGSEVLYSIYADKLYRGKITPADLKKSSKLKAALVFSFVDNAVYHRDGSLLMSASQSLTAQGDNLELLVGALIEGECGSNGLPGYAP